ncbi:uncharacterized protein B0I36DRAFT_350699 [Microdochium trichocladiopsis]|uniref:Beta/gamma crystallin 'Greek key' domain-containing protein n=1 Tax=Microdochium trichocladiopsis TaxID=1682393 RepID=A0A9P9BQ31_9PEZI|nr:uncharacterized protein B0I36DRAFT_350699 [Microdochium trichocladiopsis]KAH7029904.1 hypothetical protein B0I36DRAFT_350699 [Microdochium trichocladiopsis]
MKPVGVIRALALAGGLQCAAAVALPDELSPTISPMRSDNDTMTIMGGFAQSCGKYCINQVYTNQLNAEYRRLDTVWQGTYIFMWEGYANRCGKLVADRDKLLLQSNC